MSTAQERASSADTPPDHARLLEPGRNCWRVEAAQRATVLVDGAAYFSAFAAAAARARHSIFIVGWDFNSAVRLHPERLAFGGRDRIGRFLRRLLMRRRHLHVYVLEWDFSVIYTLQRQFLPGLRLARHHPRFHFHLDGHHPLGGAQHQKLAVVDDAVAFVGGFDFSAARWDTPAHDPDDPRRIDPWGRPYAPYHDVQLAVDGAAAAALGTLARERWQRATGDRLTPAPRGLDPWPRSLRADLEHAAVGIARTQPAFDGEPEVREVETLYLDAIAAASRSLYFENQYLTSTPVAVALAARLRESDGPEVVIVLPSHCEGWLEETTMGVLRTRLLRDLCAADRYGRLRLYYPDVAGLGARRLNVHAKLLIVDDRVLRIGSANLNNRSMGVDSECDLAIDAGADPRLRAGVRAVRDRLLGEHLGQPPERIADEVARSGSLIRVIEALSGPARGLRPCDGAVQEWLDHLMPDAALVDPERPVDAETLLAQLALPGELGRARAWVVPAAALLCAAAAALLVLAL